MLSKYFLIGEITKPQGVRGELRMRSYSDDAKNLLSIKKIYTKTYIQCEGNIGFLFNR